MPGDDSSYQTSVNTRNNAVKSRAQISQAREDDALLRLVFAFFVLVADFAIFVGDEEEDLTKAFVGVNLRRERCGVADFQRDEAFPFGFEGRDVDDDAAARIRRFSEANRQHVSGNAEVFHRARERKRVRGDDTDVSFESDQGARVKMLWIDDRGIHIGENLKLIGDANVVAVRRNSVTDDAFADLAIRERLDHLVLQRHAANPVVWLDGHPRLPFSFTKLRDKLKKARNFAYRMQFDETVSVGQALRLDNLRRCL